jgi:AcrR family transcriptional regulator
MKASDELEHRVSAGITQPFLCCAAPTRADARRDRLLDAARTLFAERGFHATGVAQIAKASGVLVGQIYRDFANKEEIVAAIAARDLEESLKEDELACATAARDVPAVRAWIRNFVAGKAKKDRRLACEIIAESLRNPRISAIFRAIQERVRGTLTHALEALAPDAASAGERALLIEVIMTIGGGIFHVGSLDGVSLDPAVADRLIALVDRELDSLVAA